MGQPAAQIVLSEIDVERALLGTFFEHPAIFGELGSEVNPEWFSDPLARYMFDECRKLIQDGHTLTTPVVVSMLPEDCNGTPRGMFYANVRLAAASTDQLSAVIATLKDRWARRELLAAADAMKTDAVQFGADPYMIASDAVLTLDTINASRADRKAGTLDSAAASLIASLAQPKGLRGPSTGLLAIDKKLNGYKAGQLYVIAGRPGMGKSAFVCSSLRRTAEMGYGVAMFSLEMTEEEIAARCISDMADRVSGPAYGDILKGMMVQPDHDTVIEVAETLSHIPLYIDASPRLTISEITARSRQAKAKLEAEGRFLAVVCIDHMGLVTPSERYRGNKVAEASEVSAMARALAKELDCCVVLLCQLSREVEKRDDRRPIMSDLRWSGEIEQDAHVVAFLYRESYYLAQDPSADPYKIQDARFKLEFLIRKNRNGETGDVPLWCSIAHSSVRDA
jgi:replicative DNA helicase